MGCKQSVPTRVVEESKIGNGSKYVHRTSDINASVDTESVLEPSNVKLEDRNENSIEESNDGVQGLFCKHLPPVGETDVVDEGTSDGSVTHDQQKDQTESRAPIESIVIHGDESGNGSSSNSLAEEYDSTEESTSESESTSTVSHIRRDFVPRSISINMEQIRLVDVLSFGSSGKVFKGEMLGYDYPIAAKRFFAPNVRKNRSQRNIFLSEISVIKTLDHPNILKYLGVAFSHPFYWVISELATRNSLEWRIRSSPSRINPVELGSVVTDIARAIDYLHSLDPPIVHRDVKPGNVLIKNDGVAVLADFGYAVKKTKHSNLVTRLGSPAYVAPEIFVGQGYDEKVDIYAFGVLMWELVFRKEPYIDMMDGSLENLMQYVCMGGRLDVPNPADPSIQNQPLGKAQLYGKYVDILERCWSHQPGVRPSAKQLLDSITAVFDGVLQKRQTTEQLFKAKPTSEPLLDLHRALFAKDSFEAGLALVSGVSLNDLTLDGWNCLHEVIATGNMEMLKFVLKWNGSEIVNVNAKTESGRDIFELSRIVSPGIAMEMFSIFRDVKSIIVNIPTFRKKVFIIGALETFVRRTFLHNALRVWQRNTVGHVNDPEARDV